MSLWNKIQYLNLNIFRTRCCKPLIFQTQICWSNRIHCLKYLRSTTFGSKDIVIRKSEFVAKNQFLWNNIKKALLLYFCFVKAGLSLRHIVHQHPEFVCGLFSPTLHQPGSGLHQPGPSLPRSLPATPPPQRHTFCRVCGQKFLLKQIRLLSLHYHQQHLR